MNRSGIAFVGRLQRHRQQRPAGQIHCVLDFVRQMRATILHLGNPRIRVARALPVLIRSLLLPLAVQPRQLLSRRILDSRRLGQLFQILFVTLPVIPPHDALHGRVGFQRRGVDRHRLPAEQSFLRQNLQHPPEHRLVRLQPIQPSRPRNRGVVRRRLVQRIAQELPQRQGIRTSARRSRAPNPVPRSSRSADVRKYTPGAMLGRPYGLFL